MNDVNAAETYSGLDVAVIGMAGRFPGASTIEAFWQNLVKGVESISFFTDEELRKSGIDHQLFSHPGYVRARGILADAEMFDAAFFGFFPKEAEQLDPQHRIFLESAWEALESAGYVPDQYKGLIGAFAGVGMNTYIIPLIAATQGKVDAAEGYQISIGNEKDFLTTKVSYKLNLRGPSMDVQTACSTSLSAVFLACQSLTNFQSDMVLAGGCTATFPQKSGYLYQEGMILSPDGHCRAFDADANGTIAGNGCGVVLLKRLEDALTDNDFIYAVIKGAACNNDGSLKVGYTAPSVDGQAQVISEAQYIANVHPDDISYIETHGTGTNLGDPIEMTALTRVFRAKTQRRQYCAIGSVKPNVGHLDAAAGVTSLIKTALALKYKQLPPSINFKKPNSKIDFDSSPFYVNNTLKEWQSAGKPRIAGVSSFGIGGTNVHLIVQEAPPPPAAQPSRSQQLLLLSARSPEAFSAARQNLVAHLQANPGLHLADVAFTLQVGRKGFSQRMAVVCRDLDDAVRTLESVDPERIMVFSHPKEVQEKSVVFMFSGQGAQYVNMGRDLYKQEPTFRETLDICCEILQPTLGLDLRDVLYPEPGNEEEAERRLEQTQLTQPALFIFEYALAQLWKEWGVKPRAMIGHSSGEYVAACLADVMSLEDALHLVALRGRLMQSMPGGAMLSVPLSVEEVTPHLNEKLAIASANAEKLTVVSGELEEIAALAEKLDKAGVNSTRLHTSHAFHSSMMEPILAPFRNAVAQVALREPQIPYISNVSGTWITAVEATDPEYYARHLRSTVQFSSGVGELLKNFDYIFLEIGPGKTLATLTRRHAQASPQHVLLSSVRHPSETSDDEAFILNTLGRLWLAGGKISWEGFSSHEVRRRVPLPTYPFERRRFWMDIEPPAVVPKKQRTRGKNPDMAQWFYEPVWKRRILRKKEDKDAHRYLLFVDIDDHDIVEPLKAAGHQIKTVQIGSSFQSEENRFHLKPDNEDHYRQLVEALKAQSFIPDRIVHAWTMSSRDVKNSLSRGFYSLLWLLKALSTADVSESVQLVVATRFAFDVIGDEPLNPENATITAACKVIGQEYPHISCRCVDTDEYSFEHVLEEFQAPASEVTVAYRHKTRWVQTFESLAVDVSDEAQTVLRSHGIYLITGGLGNIGLTIAEYLAEKVQAKLVLLDRAVFPERAEWESAVRGDESPIARKIKKIQSMEDKGAEVLVLSADISDEAQMLNILEWTREHFGALNGVIHAAGLVGSAATVAISETTREVAQSHFSPKITGSRILTEVLKGDPLDFVILQSSLSVILGGMGMYAYAAANAYLDVLAAIQNRKKGAQWMSINWDGWRFDRDPAKTGIEELSLSPEEGLKAFDILFKNSGQPQIVVSTGDLNDRFQRWVTFEALKPQMLEGASGASRHPRPNLTTPFVAPRNDAEKELADAWGDLLGIDGIGIYDDFFDLGGHSLLATQLVSRLRDKYKVELPLRSLFESPTIATISGNIRSAQESRETDDDKIADALKMVEGLTDEQVRALMQQDE